jgi:alcohol dehydrogenase
MRGLTFHGDRDVRVDELPEPTVQAPTDALVRVTMAGICGSDLHVYNAGAAFGFTEGTRLGHEFIGTVEAVGGDVRTVAPGDRVLSSVSVACEECSYCREGLFSSCERWSLFGWAPRVWAHGGVVEGAQSELMRVPLADGTLVGVPDELAGPEQELSTLPLVDMLSTAWHGLTGAGVEAGQAVVVIGDGAVGLSAVHGARAKGAEPIFSLGHHEDRLAVAERLGATHLVASREPEEIRERVREATTGRGAHVVVDTISGPASMRAAHAAVRPGGTIACLGMDHFMGKTPELDWRDQYLRNLRITGGLLPGPRYLRELIDLRVQGRLEPSPLLTHRLPLEEAPRGYAMMAAREPGVVKVALTVA